MNENEKKDALIERLKAEGQLTRNTGTNSLKSIKIELSKFSDVFFSIDNTLKVQSEVLAQILDIQKNLFEIQDSEIERLKAKEQLESVEKSVVRSGEIGEAGESPGSGTPPSSGILGNLWNKIGPGLGSFIGAGLGAAALRFPAKLGTFLLRGIPLLTLAPFIGEFVGDFAKAALKDLLSREDGKLSSESEEFVDNIGKSISNVGFWAAIGAIFGRRFAAIFGLTALGAEAAGPAVERLLEKSGLSEDGIVTAFGQEFDGDAVSKTIGATISGLTAIALMRKGIWKKLGIAGLLITATLAGGEALRTWLEKQEISEPFIDGISDSIEYMAYGYTLGRMFGPKGAIIGAAIGLAIGVGKSVVGWLNRVQDRQTDTFNEQMKEVDAIISRAAEENRSFTSEEISTLEAARVEARRRGNPVVGLNIPDELKTQAREAESIIEASIGSQPIDPESFTGQQIKSRLDIITQGKNQEEVYRAFTELKTLVEQLNASRRQRNFFGITFGGPEPDFDSIKALRELYATFGGDPIEAQKFANVIARISLPTELSAPSLPTNATNATDASRSIDLNKLLLDNLSEIKALETELGKIPLDNMNVTAIGERENLRRQIADLLIQQSDLINQRRIQRENLGKLSDQMLIRGAGGNDDIEGGSGKDILDGNIGTIYVQPFKMNPVLDQIASSAVSNANIVIFAPTNAPVTTISKGGSSVSSVSSNSITAFGSSNGASGLAGFAQ
jgi:hypothetical protein